MEKRLSAMQQLSTTNVELGEEKTSKKTVNYVDESRRSRSPSLFSSDVEYDRHNEMDDELKMNDLDEKMV